MGIFGGEGRLIGARYRLDIRLGRGGMGTVWRATDELLGRHVAVKELHVDDLAAEPAARVQRDRAMREARTVAQVKHPHVIVVHDVVEQDGRPWIVMELVEGESLADRLASGGPLPPAEAARIGLALLGALRAAHARGVLHRDIKPANVLLERDTQPVVLTDFGIAQVPGVTTLTDAGGFVGSPEYTAPERMSGRGAGPAADLWSLGVLLCAVLSGATPFRRDSTAGVLHAVVYEDVELPPPVDPLADVVRGLLERDPRRRLDVDATERLLGGAPPAAGAGTGAPGVPGAPDVTGTPDATGTPGTPGTPAYASAGRAPDPARPQARRALMVAAAVVVLAGAAAGTAAYLADGTGAGSTDESTAPHPGASAQAGAPQGKKGQRAPQGPADPRGSAPDGPAPTVTVTTSIAPGGDGSAPPGYRTVHDPAGFSMAVPTGFTRSYENDRVYYYSEGRRFRIGVQLQQPVPEGPIGAMRTADAKGPTTYDGYRDGQVVETTHNGHRAGRWEFGWDGGAQDGDARYTYDLSWNEGGRMMDVWTSSPVASRSEAERQFDTAIASFRLAGR
ncbi:serine/threonine-protein kinase [Streptomyces lunalinharesii]|uniref:non-specific serine/threonine protein kinase n=1 Tax=Streptomyces lunalinharesii TaxID=333384 RepID=A0ABN3S2V8_9ACTN